MEGGDDNSYLFPFSTCELPTTNSFVKQPYSTAVNLLTAIILSYYLFIAKSFLVKIVILSFIIFELYHAYSHITHIKGKIQSNVIHLLWYFLFISVLAVFIKINKKKENWIYIFIILIILIDLYIWYINNSFYMISSGLFILIIIVISHYYLFTKELKQKLNYLLMGTFVLILLFINEKLNCNYMLEKFKFPYHIFIELIGLVLFIMLADFFIKVEKIYL